MKKISRLNETGYNNQGCLMKIVDCNSGTDIIVEFQDEHKARVHTNYNNFQRGIVKNPYYPSVYGVGIIGIKYPVSINSIRTKEYCVWHSLIKRCYDPKTREKQPTYQNVSICEEWLLFENFCDWLRSQPNFDKWLNGGRWALDKDILIKRNKVYSPDTCCLVPQNVNCLFLKREAQRGKYPIGVRYREDGFMAVCRNPFLDKAEEIGLYSTPENAFYQGYKPYKEDIIKRVAQIEYDNENITKQCYEAMMNYIVEIDD
jgi:hypothetical protein